MRALSRGAKRLRMASLARRLDAQRRSWIHLEPRLGSLLLRWAVDKVGERYPARSEADPTLPQ
jgi:hypothetical protein